MTAVLSTRADPLAPVRQALIDRARAEASRILSAAAADEARIMAEGRDVAAAVVEGARADGESQGASVLAAEAAVTRQRARGLVLEAQRAAYQQLRTRAYDAVRGLLDDPGRRTRLASVLRDRLGGAAAVRDDPDGGLIAETDDGRSIDASVRALVEAALGRQDLDQLWGPP